MQSSEAQPASQQSFEHTPVEEVSPDDLTKDQLSQNHSVRGLKQSSSNKCKKTFIAFLVTAIVAVMLLEVNSGQYIILDPNEDSAEEPYKIIKKDENFTFLVYCPYSSYKNLTSTKKQVHEQLRRRILEYQAQPIYPEYKFDKDYSIDVTFEGNPENPEKLMENLYVVEIKHQIMEIIGTDKGNTTLVNQSILFYCGLTRGFYDKDCSNAKYRCSTPGPMFDLVARQWADVIWVNLLSNDHVKHDLEESKNNCFNASTDPRCVNYYKSDLKETYLDPASMEEEMNEKVIINQDNWPISTHLHGAEIRPTFDGNPLSWINNAGKRGHGAMSLDDKCYYDQFTQQDDDNTGYSPSNVKVTYKKSNGPCNTYKINRYPNKQNPGNLWYHDHAMRVTNFNVLSGLSGLYILRNPNATNIMNKIIPNKTFQILIMMTVNGWKFEKGGDFMSHTYYRFRFLNNNFGRKSVYQVSFNTDANCKSQATRLPFTIIAADSSVFSTPICNQTSFIIAQAQRMEVLIKFNQTKINCKGTADQKASCITICSNKYPQNSAKFSPIASQKLSISSSRHHGKDQVANEDSQIKQEIIRIEIYTNQYAIEIVGQIEKDLCELKINFGVPYKNFSNLNKPIKYLRMRPLIVYSDFVFTINGRIDFHQGQSQNPIIGQYEDWYMINTIFEGHPMHIHLINFQVIEVYDLACVKANGNICALYLLDFFVEAFQKSYQQYQNNQQFMYYYNQIYTQNQNNEKIIDYYFLCSNSSFFDNMTDFRQKMMTKVNVENEFKTIGDTQVSGIHLLQKRNDIQNKSLQYFLQQQNVQMTPQQDNSYQYVVSPIGKASPKPYYQRWKDTAFVEAYQAAVFRIRWAKSDFNQTNPEDKYFNVPVDQLRQFPGFVYHCHILGHEDNQMMRPIMLQLPQQNSHYSLDPRLKCNQNSDTSWETKYECLNEQCGVKPVPSKTSHKNH